MLIIEDTQSLDTLCKELSKEKFVTVDLEFLRERTYFAHICLIQIASLNTAAIVDPLAKGINLAPFFKLMQNKKVVKVFHSCRQDIEIILNLSASIPEPVFDTQIAAMALGFGDQVSYETLVAEIADIRLDKSCRLSDWSSRPLKAEQLEYAISDVTHLVKIYEHMVERLKAAGRDKWLEEESEILTRKDTYIVDPEEAWHKIRHRSHNSKFLTVLKELAAWRERRAQIKDLPRQNIVKDELLLTIASAYPKTREDIEKIRGIRQDLSAGRIADEMLEAVKKGLEVPAAKQVKPEPEVKMSGSAGALLELLRLLLKMKSSQEGVVPRLIADDDDLKAFASGIGDKKNPILKGWRLDLFGRDAEALRDGRLTVGYNKAKRQIEFRVG